MHDGDGDAGDEIVDEVIGEVVVEQPVRDREVGVEELGPGFGPQPDLFPNVEGLFKALWQRENKFLALVDSLRCCLVFVTNMSLKRK